MKETEFFTETVRGGARSLRVALLVAALLALALASAPRAGAFVYWANAGDVATGGGTIGRANLDGTGANQSFITGASSPCGVAVDAAHVYWANSGANSIGRANLDGTGANQSFITGASSPCGVAVDAAHVYWSNGFTIGRANLDGSNPNQSFITDGPFFATGVAVDGAHVYWANQGQPGIVAGTTIGRANLDGTGAENGFITGANAPAGVAVDGGRVYWTNRIFDREGFLVESTIGRANLDGTRATNGFITDAGGPTGVAVDGAHVYWSNGFAIGRADLDGTGANACFIDAHDPFGVAVDTGGPQPQNPPPSTSNEISLGKPERNKKKGTAKLPAEVPGPGFLVLLGKGLKTTSKDVSGAGEVKVRVKATGKKKKKLNRKGKATVNPSVTFLPTFGCPTTKDKKVTLVKRG